MKALGVFASWQGIWLATAAAFGCAAAYHLTKILFAGAQADAALFHAAFVCIDLLFAIGFLLRPAWFPLAFAILAAEQVWSHGAAALTAWSNGKVDALSLLVVAMMPVWLVLLLVHRKFLAESKAKSSQSEA